MRTSRIDTPARAGWPEAYPAHTYPMRTVRFAAILLLGLVIAYALTSQPDSISAEVIRSTAEP